MKYAVSIHFFFFFMNKRKGEVNSVVAVLAGLAIHRSMFDSDRNLVRVSFLSENEYVMLASLKCQNRMLLLVPNHMFQKKFLNLIK